VITEARFIPITPKKSPENFFFLIEKLSDTEKYLIYRVDEIYFSLEHWYRTKEIYENKGGKVILNSRLRDNISNHDYLHLTASDLIKTNQLSSFMTGASCHNKKEVSKAAELKLDYIFISPVKNVANKNPALGWEDFSNLAKLFPGPSFALGGLKREDFEIAKKNGAQGIAGISEFFQSSE
jgi:thiamine monophosphate synthase